MGSFEHGSSGRFLDVVLKWSQQLSSEARGTISRHDVLALTTRLEEHLSVIIKPLMELDEKDDPQACVAAVAAVLLEASGCFRVRTALGEAEQR